MSNLRYVKRKDIDIAKWDQCIDEAGNGLIYAFSFYLDAVCGNWDAVILDDYEAVMPLPWRKKWGITYVYQPPFIQRLGVFGNQLTEEVLITFFQSAVQHFKFIHYNIDNDPVTIPQAHFIQRKNFIIDLSTEYQLINAAYSDECTKNIRKATSRNCIYATDLNLEEVVQNFRAAYGTLNSNLQENDYTKFKQLVSNCTPKEMVQLLGIKDEHGTTIYSAAIFKDKKRLYYVLGAPTAAGREKRATYYFIDQVLRKNAGQPLYFDFEGSDLPNVASFYKKFGPSTEHYYEVKINALPPFMKWLKS